ncbi:MAG: helix-turn-helix domain-containing protein, partial [Enterococcus faecium]
MLERGENMLNLLSKKLQRQLNLLEILFEGERCRLSQLEKRLASSGKTLRNDFIEINTYSSDIQIVTDRDAGVTAIFSPAFTKDHIYQIVISQSTEYKYLETILLHPKENYL